MISIGAYRDNSAAHNIIYRIKMNNQINNNTNAQHTVLTLYALLGNLNYNTKSVKKKNIRKSQ